MDVVSLPNRLSWSACAAWERLPGAVRKKMRGISTLSLLAILGSVVVFGCALPPPSPISTASLPELGPRDGLLVVQVDTDVAVGEISLNRAVVVQNLPKGKHLWVVRLPAGSYEWESVSFGANSGTRARYRTSDLVLTEDSIDPRDEFHFEVVAGRINYPGEIIIRTSEFSRSASMPIEFRIRNHAAMAIRRMRETHPRLIESFPVRYAGSRGDTFLEHWESIRTRSDLQEPGGGV